MELITVVMILAVLACIAIPRLDLAAVTGASLDAVVHRMAADLRRARADAILYAARNPAGFALILSGEEAYDSYRIISLHDAAVTVACKIPRGIVCKGGRRFEFGPLGNLRSGSDTQLHIATNARAYTLAVAPATGAVKWTRDGD